ncbi:MAG: nuclear transport factor 2 family protein [Candidatus Devosia phytovorans]|uniref:Nuclear transport factor 2 family protein n=1 Tax=Candidatus Devosia phytovorans TaxID=3121372 RepID=A0AAJ5VW54_9HYPH|nr:nuclear transport factor 2 family protein [Devosia sp.]WEK06011.1 MAG: nuclear transport factor 2 family protein [Devosia sp.]
MPSRESFPDFLKRRAKASEDFLNGDFAAMLAMTSQEDPSTFFPRSGIAVSGAQRVNDVHRQTAREFVPGGSAQVEILQSGSDVEMGFWAGIVRAQAVLKGQSAPVSVNLRITEVFRRNEQGWKLVHRHADEFKA